MISQSDGQCNYAQTHPPSNLRPNRPPHCYGGGQGCIAVPQSPRYAYKESNVVRSKVPQDLHFEKRRRTRGRVPNIVPNLEGVRRTLGRGCDTEHVDLQVSVNIDQNGLCRRRGWDLDGVLSICCYQYSSFGSLEDLTKCIVR